MAQNSQSSVCDSPPAPAAAAGGRGGKLQPPPPAMPPTASSLSAQKLAAAPGMPAPRSGPSGGRGLELPPAMPAPSSRAPGPPQSLGAGVAEVGKDAAAGGGRGKVGQEGPGLELPSALNASPQKPMMAVDALSPSGQMQPDGGEGGEMQSEQRKRRSRGGEMMQPDGGRVSGSPRAVRQTASLMVPDGGRTGVDDAVGQGFIV